MLQSKEVREYELDRAVLGGYEMRGVEALLEEVADTLELLETENADLRGQIGRYSDQVAQYQRTDSEFRKSLLAAQKFADEIRERALADAEKMRADARKEADKLLSDTKNQCKEIVERYREQGLREQEKFRRAQRECSTFIEEMSRAFREQSEAIAAIADSELMEKTKEIRTGRVDTMKSQIVRPEEPEVSIQREIPKEAQMPEDLLQLFAAANKKKSRSGCQQTEYTVELTGTTPI